MDLAVDQQYSGKLYHLGYPTGLPWSLDPNAIKRIWWWWSLTACFILIHNQFWFGVEFLTLIINRSNQDRIGSTDRIFSEMYFKSRTKDRSGMHDHQYVQYFSAQILSHTTACNSLFLLLQSSECLRWSRSGSTVTTKCQCNCAFICIYFADYLHPSNISLSLSLGSSSRYIYNKTLSRCARSAFFHPATETITAKRYPPFVHILYAAPAELLIHVVASSWLPLHLPLLWQWLWSYRFVFFIRQQRGGGGDDDKERYHHHFCRSFAFIGRQKAHET